MENVKTIQVDREDFASLSVNVSDSNVLKGDTIAIFSSSHTNFIIEEKTGAKAEDVFLTKEKIKSLKKQKEVLEKRISDYKIVAPFDGTTFGLNSLDTLFTISKSNSYVVLIPINVDISNSIKIGQSINFPDSDSLYNIKIETRDPQSKMIIGQNYFIYKSYFQTTNKKLFSGIYECTIREGVYKRKKKLEFVDITVHRTIQKCFWKLKRKLVHIFIKTAYVFCLVSCKTFWKVKTLT
ncbi:MAG: hypothetical protein L3J41_12545 [Melioribacteraceae bacterium]|nr:hypothetical protein [Melioribacteraceae bacterium]